MLRREPTAIVLGKEDIDDLEKVRSELKVAEQGGKEGNGHGRDNAVKSLGKERPQKNAAGPSSVAERIGLTKTRR